jgi:glycosyltransferase involved in cell wall biosynthesis
LIGEVARYLADGQTGYLARPGSAAAYGAKIIEAITDPARASAIGAAGRQLAMRRFHYANHGSALRAFFQDVHRNFAAAKP